MSNSNRLRFRLPTYDKRHTELNGWNSWKLEIQTKIRKFCIFLFWGTCRRIWEPFPVLLQYHLAQLPVVLVNSPSWKASTLSVLSDLPLFRGPDFLYGWWRSKALQWTFLYFFTSSALFRPLLSKLQREFWAVNENSRKLRFVTRTNSRNWRESKSSWSYLKFCLNPNF